MADVAHRSQLSRSAVLTVRVGEHLFAIPIESIDEVLPSLPVESVPLCAPAVRGVVHVRGELIPVLDSAALMNLEREAERVDPHIVCLRHDDHRVGVEVDEALDLAELPAESGLSPKDFGTAQSVLKAVLEIEGRVVRLFDPASLIASAERSEPASR